MTNYIVDFTQDAVESDIDTYLIDHKCVTIKIYDNFDKVYLVNAETTPPITDIVDSVISDDDTVIALLGDVTQTNTYNFINDPSKPSILISTKDKHDWWKNYVLNAPDFSSDTIEISRKGELAIVYIVDSGIDASHPEFVNANISNLYSLTDNFSDTTGHGTAIASVISGSVCGLSSANLKIVKIFDKAVLTKQSDLLSGFDSILTDYITSGHTVGIINCSWSIPKNQYIENKIQTIIDAGLYVVVSSGNNGLPISDVTPASMSSVLTIGSYSPDLLPSNFSNYTDPSVTSLTLNETNHGSLDGWAPGEEIRVAVPGGTYGYSAGTSIAAAIHSCVLAYNFSDFITTNQVASTYAHMATDYLHHLCLGHTGILNLSDEKYINSINKTSTLLNNYQRTNVAYKHNLTGAIKAGDFIVVDIFEVHDTVSFEIVGEFPEGLTILSSGKLYGIPTQINEQRKLFTSVLHVTQTDNSVISYDMAITVLNSDVDMSTLPFEDALVSLTFANCGCNCPCICDTKTSCRCDCSCFTADSMVLMADGTSKAISTILIGESVASINGNVTVIGIDHPLLGNRPLVSFDNGLCKTSYEHVIWSKDNMGKEWWATRGMTQWKYEADNGFGSNFNGVLPFDLTERYSDAWNFAHVDGWKEHTTTVIPSSPDTQLYHLWVDGTQSYFVDGYLVNSMSDSDNFVWADLNWSGKK